MKKKYIIPEIEELQFYSDAQILGNSDEHGTVSADGEDEEGNPNMLSKQAGKLDEETGIPNNFSNIWGDED